MRVTRAAARIAEDETQTLALDLETPLNSAPKTPLFGERSPLGDITGSVHNGAENTQEDLCVDLGNLIINSPVKKSPKKRAAKGKKGKKTKQANKENIPEVWEDDNESTASSAVEEACEDLMRPVDGTQTYQIPMHDHDRPTTPPSKAVQRVRKALSPKSHTPHFDPSIHLSPVVLRSPTKAQAQNDLGRRDSFLDIIETRSPAKLVQPRVPNDVIEEAELVESQEEDLVAESPAASMASPVGSPGTPGMRARQTRIEDSLAAQDAMEEALDEVEKSLANFAKTRSQLEITIPSEHLVDEPEQDGSRMPSQISASPAKAPTPKQATTPAKTTRPRPRSTLYEPTAASARAATPKKETKPAITTKNSTATAKPKPAVAKPATRKPFVPTKSTKPVTQPTFKLPGEAVSARIKAQREARLASNASTAVASATTSTRSSSATEKCKSTVPEVRLTAAARARLSMVKGEKPAAAAPLPVAKTRKVTRPTAVPSVASKPTAASAVRAGQTRASVAPAPTTKTTPAGPVRKPVTKPTLSTKTTPANSPRKPVAQPVAKPAANTPLKRAVSARHPTVAAVVKADAGLKRAASTSVQPVKKTTPAVVATKVPVVDRAEAARRVRAEAAERGRLASQQWAEKMRVKRQSLDLSERQTPKPAA